MLLRWRRLGVRIALGRSARLSRREQLRRRARTLLKYVGHVNLEIGAQRAQLAARRRRQVRSLHHLVLAARARVVQYMMVVVADAHLLLRRALRRVQLAFAVADRRIRRGLGNDVL